MGFLYALLMMCSWMIYGGANFYMNACNITMEEGELNEEISTYSKMDLNKIINYFLTIRSHQFNCRNWSVQSVDWLGDCKRIAPHRLGGTVDNLSNISDCMVGNDNK